MSGDTADCEKKKGLYPLSPERLEVFRRSSEHGDPAVRCDVGESWLGELISGIDTLTRQLRDVEIDVQLLTEKLVDASKENKNLREEIDSAKHKSRLMSAAEHENLKARILRLTIELQNEIRHKKHFGLQPSEQSLQALAMESAYESETKPKGQTYENRQLESETSKGNESKRNEPASDR